MSAAPSPFYSAAQLARAAGISKRQLLAELRGAPVSGKLIIRGNEADAWTVAALPEKHLDEIQRRAALLGPGQNVHAFINQVDAPWQPPIPLEQIAPAAITKAAALRRALARVLELRDNPLMGAAEIEAMGLEDYRREFGHAVTGRTLRALVGRTVERDNCAENWSRLEIYLDGNPPRKCATPATTAACEAFAQLNDLMATFKSAIQPGSREKEALWQCAVELLHGNGTGLPQKRTRVKLVAWLWRCAPWLARSKNALRVALAERYSIHLKRDCAPNSQRDGREARRGIATTPPIPQIVIDNVTACSLFKTGGRLSQAVREVRDRAAALGIDADAAELLCPESKDKSYANRRLREAVRNDVRMAAPNLLGSRAQDNVRAAIQRKYDFPAGYIFSADDVTLPVYWIVPDGRGWFNLVRGQCIITIDVRSLRILGFSLQPDRNYSSPVIHTNFTRVFSDFGVPRKLYLERGIWENSKLITGGARSRTNHADYDFMPLSWAETERGFADLGVTFHHAIRARSKVVERVIGLVQNLMEGEAGYCGRDERRDCPALIRQQMDAVKCQRADSEKNFYDFNQWEARLVEIFKHYNAEEQQGEILAGLSPDEAWNNLQSDEPAKQPLLFDQTCRHLLAHYRVLKEPGRDGIPITIGRKKWIYRNEQLGRDKHKKLLAWFNPDEPSCLAVTDLNMKNPYTVPLSNPVDAIDPDPELLATELARVAEYEAYGKARYQTLKANFATKFRRFAPNRAMVETGQTMRQQREIVEVQKRQAETRRQTIQRHAEKTGLPESIINPGPAGERGMARMLEAIRNREKAKASAQPESL